MYDHGTHLLVALISSFALAAPVPLAAEGRTMFVVNCTGGNIRIDIPADPLGSTGHECCKKGCHAANHRRKKRNGENDGCY
jgi:hypothetical protein